MGPKATSFLPYADETRNELDQTRHSNGDLYDHRDLHDHHDHRGRVLDGRRPQVQKWENNRLIRPTESRLPLILFFSSLSCHPSFVLRIVSVS